MQKWGAIRWLNAVFYFKREDGLREPVSRLTAVNDGKPRQFVSKHCVNLISELLEYREDVKKNGHATDALCYSLLLELETSRFCMLFGVDKIPERFAFNARVKLNKIFILFSRISEGV